MLTHEGVPRPPTPLHRTERDLRRRHALADAATGIAPYEAAVPEQHEFARIERFRCVIYVCGAPATDIATPRDGCVEYAEAFCWRIADVIEDHAIGLPPEEREGLKRAIDYVEKREAGAVLTAYRSMISQLPQEFDRVARDIEKSGGFLHIKDSAHSR